VGAFHLCDREGAERLHGKAPVGRRRRQPSRLRPRT
jgi:hypothetical protein